MKALILHSQLSGYFYNCLLTLLEQGTITSIEVLSFHQSSIAPFSFGQRVNLSIIYIDDLSSKEVFNLSIRINPQVIYMSGWFNPTYNKIARFFKRKCLPVVMGLDNQWNGGLRQIAGVFLAPFMVNRMATHVWVAGIYQYEFARKLGFKRTQILFNLYAADTKLFSKDVQNSLQKKKVAYPKRILFTGRLVPEKGVMLLVDSFLKQNKKITEKWELTIVGNGPLADHIPQDPCIKVLKFIQPESLALLMQDSGIFCLPSNTENWGVVLQEAAASGLPIISSDSCGAATVFVKDNYNGFQFKTGSQEDLSKKLGLLMQFSPKHLLQMAENSILCAQSISPDLWAATFSAVLRKFEN